ncbi:MAG: ABC transporter ATP-binding protein, partial [Flavobacteriaceae bacterium]|nr:ABC transporter ATP-binding protein [Flavobacteriaceae bacterium]
MNYLKPILRYAIPYKFYALLNIICNIFYAFFGTLSMISLFPMLKVLFGDSKPLLIKPEWEGFGNLTTYGENYLNYFITLKKSEGNNDVLIFMVGFIIGSFLLKNLFSYLAMFFITFLRNGVLRDMG